jgi:hypothetical protein
MLHTFLKNAVCDHVPSVIARFGLMTPNHILPSDPETEFHVHTNQQAKYIFMHKTMDTEDT